MNGAAGPSLIPGAIKRILQSAKIGLWLFFMSVFSPELSLSKSESPTPFTCV